MFFKAESKQNATIYLSGMLAQNAFWKMDEDSIGGQYRMLEESIYLSGYMSYFYRFPPFCM